MRTRTESGGEEKMILVKSGDGTYELFLHGKWSGWIVNRQTHWTGIVEGRVVHSETMTGRDIALLENTVQAHQTAV